VAVSGVVGYGLLIGLTLATPSVPAVGERCKWQSDPRRDRGPSACAWSEVRQRHGRTGFHGHVVLRPLMRYVGVARGLLSGS
jgi:hypothetical protein